MIEITADSLQISRQDLKETIVSFRTKLLNEQQLLKTKNFPVIIIIGGLSGAGKSETANKLSEWLDPRGLSTHAFGPPSQEELEKPAFWRFWQILPPKGEIGILINGWYNQPLLDRVYGQTTLKTFEYNLDRIVSLEKQLVNDGTLIIKLWIHVAKDSQRERLDLLEKNPLTRWRVTIREKEHLKNYEQFNVASRTLIKRTSKVETEWHLIEDNEVNARTLKAATIVHDILNLNKKNTKSKSDYVPPIVNKDKCEVIRQLDMEQHLPKNEYKIALEKFRGRLYELTIKARQKGIPTILVFEGVDAAGKGGAIRRLIGALDSFSYKVIPISAPNEEEKQHHYMWRFWRHLPRNGQIAIFDRSWYGRVLVERVEGFATNSEWRRSYSEINDFENQLVENKSIVIKFWIQISKDEQLKRFKDRESTPHKAWKITDEDWRNREKWDDYEKAVEDMINLTNTSVAPWTIVEGNDKRFARIKVLRSVCDQMESGIAF